ncbi:hypothetical protein AMTR_s00036p00232310 [Amborella trichopoda]|uniref:Dof zinc finger protein n=1 Tax=Amborella trichopoda TaxID=13333 RepID=U5CZ60_AMBTC|nr:hypothetical protein AMTR_s00036p00232310 [Amborella trichopoda]
MQDQAQMISDKRALKPQSFIDQEQQQLKCPRCESMNTKFCYYNNYNLSQPRHFCKNCRRYWTKGGALRNIPVGGGSRKNTKRSASSTARPKAVAAPENEPVVGNLAGKLAGIYSGVREEEVKMMEITGSFSSLLNSGERGFWGLPESGDSGAPLMLQNEAWIGAAWGPDLAMYTPGTAGLQ